MSKDNINTPFEPVVKANNGHLFSVRGKVFSITDREIKESAPNTLMESLAQSTQLFNVQPSGISFYCGNGSVFPGKESPDGQLGEMLSNARKESLNNSKKLVNEQYKLQALEEKRDELNKQYLKDYSQSEIVESIKEVDSKIDEKKKDISQIKKKPMLNYIAYDAAADKAFVNGEEIDGSKGVARYCLESGLVDYKYKSYLDIFETSINNFSCFKNLDFCSQIEENNILYVPMKISDNTYIYRHNYDTRLSEFKNMKPNELVDHILESTGKDITYLVEGIYEKEKTFEQEKAERVNELKNMLSFLYEKKEELNHVDADTPELKKAKRLLDEEINSINKNVKVLESEELSRDNGYVQAIVKREFDAVEKGQLVKVDAMDFTNAGKDDYVSTYVDGDHIKLQKADLELKSDELS